MQETLSRYSEQIKDFLTGKKNHTFSRTAIFEMVAFYTIALLINYTFGDGKRFLDVSPHPFWIPTVLISAQYGTLEGSLSALIGAFCLYTDNLPAQNLNEDIFAYQLRVLSLPLEWLITAFIVGSIRDRHAAKEETLTKSLEKAQSNEQEAIFGFTQMKVMKESLEARIASDLRTSISMYRSIKDLGAERPAKVLFGLQSLVDIVLNPEQSSLFSVGANGLEAVTQKGWEEGDHFCRRFPPDTGLYSAIVLERRVLSILNKEDEIALQYEGILAAPLVDETSGTVFGMLKVEKMDVDSLTLANIEAFRLLCEAAGSAYAHAKRFQTLLAHQMYDELDSIYSSEFFRTSNQFLEKIWGFLDLPLGVLKIRPYFEKNFHIKADEVAFSQLSKTLIDDLFGKYCIVCRLPSQSFGIGVILPSLDRYLVEVQIESLKKEFLTRWKGSPLHKIELELKWSESFSNVG